METQVQLPVGCIERFAGNGKARSTGDGKLAVKAGIPLPHHVTLDRDQAWLYIAESGSDRIRRVNLREGTLHNFAGIGETCYSGDDGPCGEAGLYLPLDVAVDSQNNLYVCDSGSNRIRRIDAESGVITTVAGTGQFGFNGDGPALDQLGNGDAAARAGRVPDHGGIDENELRGADARRIDEPTTVSPGRATPAMPAETASRKSSNEAARGRPSKPG